jgi:hypothetical protein
LKLHLFYKEKKRFFEKFCITRAIFTKGKANNILTNTVSMKTALEENLKRTGW